MKRKFKNIWDDFSEIGEGVSTIKDCSFDDDNKIYLRASLLTRFCISQPDCPNTASTPPHVLSKHASSSFPCLETI